MSYRTVLNTNLSDHPLDLIAIYGDQAVSDADSLTIHILSATYAVDLSIKDTVETQLAVLYTVEPLYRRHHWDPAGCPVYSGTSL